ncbi:hypothetical protein [Reyranella sp. CPCC 100927]|uniref:hypothetical protein n=1 Tax=Reyranella sp. CPCC 100927 TaxID=2599616 RepID=UPI0011B7F4CB|nr:hypothetical protein [Reyranella sp. CPCC 100927]TWT13713.1 hypothetical protein FQU96_07290 [Reyranella sp. CPCC 100927]
MTPYLAVQTPRPDFEAFLFAPIGEERNGMTLSVLSGLSRLEVNPWDEAAELSQLPKDRAIAALDRRIAQLPLGTWLLSDTAAIATRLVNLLPKHDPHPRVHPTAAPADDKRSSASLTLWLIAAGIAVLLVLGIPGRVEHMLTGDGAVAPIHTPSSQP